MTHTDLSDSTCLTCGSVPSTTLPLRRIIDKLDRLLAQRDFAAAKRHLDYWIAEAQSMGDGRSEASLENERMGLFRKCGEKENAIQAAERALSLLAVCQLQDSLFGGTVCLNAATVYKAFGCLALALPLYEQAKMLYTRYLSKDDLRFAGLYNNYALALCEDGRFDAALVCFREALALDLSHAKTDPTALADAAITCLNMADTFYDRQMQSGEDLQAQIDEVLDQAELLLKDEALPKDAYYAFVAEKCAPAFAFHGRFFTEQYLKRISEQLYAAQK